MNRVCVNQRLPASSPAPSSAPSPSLPDQIIAKVDTANTLAPASGRTDLKAWQKSVQTLMRKLQRPRYVKVPLPEFMQKAGRDAFVNNHQMPPYEKSEWKGNPDMASTQAWWSGRAPAFGDSFGRARSWEPDGTGV